MIEESRLQQIGKTSRRNAFLSSLGFLIVAASLVYGAWHLSHLNKAIEEKKGQIDSLEARRDSLKRILQHLDSTLATPPEERANAALAEIMKPRVEAKPVPGVRGYKDLQIYDFSLWLDVPAAWKEKITQVTYEFNHPSFRDKTQTSDDRSTGFRVGYRGWGCLHIVTITITTTDGSSSRFDFDMCKELGVGE